MNTKMIRILFLVLILTTLFLPHGPGTFLMAQGTEKTKPQMRQPTTYDRVSRAADFGEITLKEAVLLKAKLLFAPALIPEGSTFAPKPGEILAQEDCLTGFYKDVHRVLPELNEEERKFLRSLSPDLEAIIRQREKEEKGSTN
jgi:hypothetical protein